MDELLVIGNSADEIAKVEERMNKIFRLSDQGEVGELEYYLGVEVSTIDENTLLLHQTAYPRKVLARFNMTDCKIRKTPLPRYLKISLMDSPDEVDPDIQVHGNSWIIDVSISVDMSGFGICRNVSVKISS